ncbi:MAG: VWA domain-containing protein [Zoogloeaceae bacterium]|jgi:Ca-activated chloride channel family protein|nr:VWA domain-containing protein [Zoogloeaceae bacterium]
MKTSAFRFLRIALAALTLASLAVLPNRLQAAESVQLRVELDRGVLPVAAKETAVVKISLDGLRAVRPEARPPVNVALVIDRSGSMSGEKIEQARAAAIEAVRRLSGKDIVSVVAFESEARTLVPATRVTARRDIERIIERIQIGGSTALHGGVVEGAAQIRENLAKPGYTHRVILLSDGQANVGPSSADELGQLGVDLVRKGISVSTIGLGLGYDEDLMTRLALKSDGNTYFAQNAAMLPEIFNTELGDVLNVVARNVDIIIRFPDGVRPLRFLGREGKIAGQRAELRVNQLYGGQEKFALIEIAVPAEKDQESRELAAVSVTFEDALTQEKHAQKAAVSARFSANKADVVRSANHQVQADYAEALIVTAKEEAIALADEGKQKDAAERLRKTNSSVQKLGETYGNKRAAAIARETAELSDSVEAAGVSNSQRKQMRTDNAQKSNQQGSKSSSSGGKP